MSQTTNKPFWQASKSANGNGVNANMPGGFWNDLDPARFYKSKKELPIHRRCAELCLQGFTNLEIAQQLGRSPVTISNVLRQPAVRLHMQEAVKATVKDEMTAFLDEELMANLRLCKEIRDDPRQRAADRLAAAAALTERRLGKANQPISIDKPVSALSAEELAAEVAEALKAINPNADREADSNT